MATDGTESKFDFPSQMGNRGFSHRFTQITQISNFASPPAKPEDFLWIKGRVPRAQGGSCGGREGNRAIRANQ